MRRRWSRGAPATYRCCSPCFRSCPLTRRAGGAGYRHLGARLVTNPPAVACLGPLPAEALVVHERLSRRQHTIGIAAAELQGPRIHLTELAVPTFDVLHPSALRGW